MQGIISKPDTHEKLDILSRDARYDLACACGTSKEEHRLRGDDGRWIYPVTLPSGGRSYLFKTLLSNVCANDCKYCPLRQNQDVTRCTLRPEETARVFLDYLYGKKVAGLFLSSAVIGSPDATMERLNATAKILRQKYNYRGYIHLKIIPGASDAAVEEAVSLSSAVSINIETPGEKYLAKLSDKKNYIGDIIGPMKLISRLTAKGAKYQGVKQTTQFIVGAAGESDAEIIKYTWGLYKRLKLQRVYFSGYQKGLGEQSLPGERTELNPPSDVFVREHRLYQVDFLIRKYGFDESEIPFDRQGNLSLTTDPKEAWARQHPEYFPINVNRATAQQLLRVPGLGTATVEKILQNRKSAAIKGIEDIGKFTSRMEKANKYLVF
jgi:predicted DNA-binding helix-hairpin-helix protein